MIRAHNEYLFLDLINQGCLEIDNNGKVWRIARLCGNQYIKGLFVKTKRKQIAHKINSGYLQINRKILGKTVHCLIHRLVWIYFNGGIPNEFEINHKNGIKNDNHPKNLEIITHSENEKHAYRTGLIFARKGQKLLAIQGEKNGRAKLTENDIIKIRERYKNGEYQKIIAKDFGVSRVQISHIVNKKHWIHI